MRHTRRGLTLVLGGARSEGLLAQPATYITWDDADDNGAINAAEMFLEMDVVHNSLIKCGIGGVSEPKLTLQEIRVGRH